MTQTANEISPLSRTTIKANNIVVWHIESSSGHTYATTIFEGKVTSCKREDGTSCPGFHHSGTCHHGKLALAREDERMQEAYASRLHNGVTLEIYNKAIESQNSTSDADRNAFNNVSLALGWE
jgi:hypothetical protein